MGKSRKHTPADKWERVGGMAALGAAIAPAPAASPAPAPTTTAATMTATTPTMNTTTTAAAPAAAPANTPAPAPAPATSAAPAAAPAPAPKADLEGKVVKQWLLDHTVPQRMILDKTLDFLGIMPESCTVQAKAGDGGILLVVGPAADVLSFYHKGKGDWKFQSPSQVPGGMVSLPVVGLNEGESVTTTVIKTVEVAPPAKAGFAGLVETELVGGVTVGQIATGAIIAGGAYAAYQNREMIMDGIKSIPSWFGFGKKEEA